MVMTTDWLIRSCCPLFEGNENLDSTSKLHSPSVVKPWYHLKPSVALELRAKSERGPGTEPV